MDMQDSKILGACIEIKNNNYGSMLQSYATQVMLDEYGIKYELLQYKKKYTPIFVIKSIPRLFNSVVWQDKINEKEKRNFLNKNPGLKADVKKRSQAFEKFRKEFFRAPVVTYYGYSELKKQSIKYAAFLTGSDQLWSPSGLPTNFYNLMFTYEDAVRVSFASSFGVKEIPWYQRSRTKAYLDRIQYISCREESGSRIVKELTGRDVPVVADPTMLFSGEQWNAMLPTSIGTPQKYIFSYILGTNTDYRNQVLKLKEKTGLPIVSIHQYVKADMNFGDVVVEGAGPAEFVNLIRNAEYVCTDSFHGSVFSILNHRKFVVFNRYSELSVASKNTRIQSLCDRLGLQSRRFKEDIWKDMSPDIDYTNVDMRLEQIRTDTREYLEKALSSIRG